MPLKDAPKIDREVLFQLSKCELLDKIQELETKAYHNRQLFEFACKDHCHDFMEIEVELTKAGIPEDDGYSCYAPADRIKLLAAKVPKE